jgi:hypothetical protein
MSALSNKVFEIATSYMGPVGQKFIERQTSSHMNGLPAEKLEASHLAELSKWIEISAGLLMDHGKAAEFAAKVRSL